MDDENENEFLDKKFWKRIAILREKSNNNLSALIEVIKEELFEAKERIKLLEKHNEAWEKAYHDALENFEDFTSRNTEKKTYTMKINLIQDKEWE